MVVVTVREACGFVRSMCYHFCLLFLCGSFSRCRIKRLLLISVVLIFTKICSYLAVTNCWDCSLAVFWVVLSLALCK